MHFKSVIAESSLLIEFDYTTYGNGVLNFHMLDTDGYGTYHLLFDTGNTGIWKSFSYSIAGGYNIQVITNRERDRERDIWIDFVLSYLSFFQ